MNAATQSVTRKHPIRTAKEGECCKGHTIYSPCKTSIERKEAADRAGRDAIEIGDMACITCDVRFMAAKNWTNHLRDHGEHVVAFFCWRCGRYETADAGR